MADKDLSFADAWEWSKGLEAERALQLFTVVAHYAKMTQIPFSKAFCVIVTSMLPEDWKRD